jgi:molybdopterin/thiamine biosynthesis adenylyltransferase
MTLSDQIQLVSPPADAASATAPAQPTAPTIQVTADEAASATDDRFHRFRLIRWWDQAKLSRAKVLVIGAGALGNEIVKNLALLGVGNVLIVDMDKIENSNLSRSVLYRASDNGSSKAQAAARAARDIYPGMRTHALDANAVYDLGMGVYRWADVVMGGLDNREARLSINRNCLKVGRPWVDGAIEQIQGTARVFTPDSPCYECTMSDTDWRLLQLRRSCNLLTRPEMEGGKTPTTPTISSIIAGVQCQEAVKLLHGLETIKGRGWVFDGLSTEAYQVEFQRKATFYSHEPLDEVIPLDSGVDDITIGELLNLARQRLGPGTELELARDVLEKLVCPGCGSEEAMFQSLGRVKAEKAWCPACRAAGRDVRREVLTFYKVRGDEPFLDRTPAEIGVPPFDIIMARGPQATNAGAAGTIAPAGEETSALRRAQDCAGRLVGLELSCDAENVLGPLWDGEALEWS